MSEVTGGMAEELRCGLLQGLQLLPLTSWDVAVRLDAVTSCLLMVMERQGGEDMVRLVTSDPS